MNRNNFVDGLDVFLSGNFFRFDVREMQDDRDRFIVFFRWGCQQKI